MWNFAALDRSPTINRQVYFQIGVTPKASSNARKILILSPIHPRTSSHLRKHRTSVPSGPQKLPGAPQPHPDAPPMHPQPLPGGPQPQPHPSRSQATPATPRYAPNAPLPLHPHSPPNPSYTPDVPLPPQIRTQFPNRSDSVIQSETNKQVAQRELHAKLQHLRPLAGPVATPHGGHRAQAATHPDR